MTATALEATVIAAPDAAVAIPFAPPRKSILFQVYRPSLE